MIELCKPKESILDLLLVRLGVYLQQFVVVFVYIEVRRWSAMTPTKEATHWGLKKRLLICISSKHIHFLLLTQCAISIWTVV